MILIATWKGGRKEEILIRKDVNVLSDRFKLSV